MEAKTRDCMSGLTVSDSTNAAEPIAFEHALGGKLLLRLVSELTAHTQASKSTGKHRRSMGSLLAIVLLEPYTTTQHSACYKRTIMRVFTVFRGCKARSISTPLIVDGVQAEERGQRKRGTNARWRNEKESVLPRNSSSIFHKSSQLAPKRKKDTGLRRSRLFACSLVQDEEDEADTVGLCGWRKAHQHKQRKCKQRKCKQCKCKREPICAHKLDVNPCPYRDLGGNQAHVEHPCSLFHCPTWSAAACCFQLSSFLLG